MAQLVIRCSGSNALDDPLLWPSTAALIDSSTEIDNLDLVHVNLAGLAPQFQAASPLQVTLIIAAELVTSLAAGLPKMTNRMLRKALPFAVEEQLLDAIETYHIALLGREREGKVIACAIKRELMSSITGFLDSHFPASRTRIIVDGWLLASSPGSICQAEEDGRLLIQYDHHRCITARDSQSEAIALALKLDASVDWTCDEWTGAGIVAGSSEDLGDLLLREAARYAGPDLRQGEFGAPSSIKKVGPLATLLLTFLICTITYGGFQRYEQLLIERRSADVLAETKEIYRSHFPSQGRIVNMPAQAKQHLAKLQKVPETNEKPPEAFLPLLATFAATATAQSIEGSVSIGKITFILRERAMVIELSAVSIATLLELQAALQRKGVAAAVLSASESDTEFGAKIRIGLDDE